MALIIEKAPGVLKACEMHGKKAKSDDSGKAPARAKRIDVTLDLSAKKYAEHLEEFFPGYDLLSKAMSGVNATAAQDLVSHAKVGECSFEMTSPDGSTEVFTIDTAQVKGRLTLRISKAAAKTEMNLRLVGNIARAKLSTIDDWIGADGRFTVQTLQMDIEDEANKKKGAKLQAVN